jgi:hypothetical protein
MIARSDRALSLFPGTVQIRFDNPNAAEIVGALRQGRRFQHAGGFAVQQGFAKASRYDSSSRNPTYSFRRARRAKWHRGLCRAVSSCRHCRLARGRCVPDHAHYREPARVCL